MCCFSVFFTLLGIVVFAAVVSSRPQSRTGQKTELTGDAPVALASWKRNQIHTEEKCMAASAYHATPIHPRAAAPVADLALTQARTQATLQAARTAQSVWPSGVAASHTTAHLCTQISSLP